MDHIVCLLLLYAVQSVYATAAGRAVALPRAPLRPVPRRYAVDALRRATTPSRATVLTCVNCDVKCKKY